MISAARLVAVLLAILAAGTARAQSADDALILVAHPAFRDLEYRQTVLIAAPAPNDARYFVGYVGWRPGELKGEIDRGLWSPLDADIDRVFRKDTEGLWEELIQVTKRIRAEAPPGGILVN